MKRIIRVLFEVKKIKEDLIEGDSSGGLVKGF